MNQRKIEVILDIPIDRSSLPIGIQITMAGIDRVGPAIVFACANPHSLVVAQTDTEFKSALTSASLVVADGVGLTFMARIGGMKLGPRITGTDYFQGILGALQERGDGRVFFFGSSQKVLDLIATRFRSDYPSLTLCGILSPPYGTWSAEENCRMVQTINEARPDVLWVGMTAPKQEKWVEANRKQLDVPVIASIGAVFDFYAGTYARAPQWICRMGFEWVYRLLLEPRRMWKRNLISTPKFIWLILWRHGLGIKS